MTNDNNEDAHTEPKEQFLRRSCLGANYTILHELRTFFQEDYKKFLLVEAKSFDYIFEVVTLIISTQELQDTRIRNNCCIEKNGQIF